MTISVTLVDTGTDTFENWVNKTNEIANLISNSVMTSNSDANGSTTSGNSQHTGILSGNVVTVVTGIRGGNVQSTVELPITSNVALTGEQLTIGNSTVNSVSNSITISISNSSASIVIDKDQVKIGNSTVNSVSNSTAIALANSTVTYDFVMPTASQKAGTTYFLNANGTWAEYASGGNVETTGTSAQEVDNWSVTTYYAKEYRVVISDNNANNRTFTRLSVLQDEGSVYQSEYSLIDSNTTMGTFSSNANATHVKLYLTPSSTNTTVRFVSEPVAK